MTSLITTWRLSHCFLSRLRTNGLQHRRRVHLFDAGADKPVLHLSAPQGEGHCEHFTRDTAAMESVLKGELSAAIKLGRGNGNDMLKNVAAYELSSS